MRGLTFDKSIAVLPFADLSPQGDQEYFSGGIADELLNLLGRFPDCELYRDRRHSSSRARTLIWGRSQKSSMWPTCWKVLSKKPKTRCPSPRSASVFIQGFEDRDEPGIRESRIVERSAQDGQSAVSFDGLRGFAGLH